MFDDDLNKLKENILYLSGMCAGYSLNASHMANGTELKDIQPRHLKPSVNLIHYHSKNSVNSQSIPSLLSMDDSIASEPLYTGRAYDEIDGEQVDPSGYLPVHDLSIKRILGSFPDLPFYRPPSSAGSSTENIAKVNKANNSRAVETVPIARPRSSVTSPTASLTPSRSNKDFNLNSSLFADYAPVHKGGSEENVSNINSKKEIRIATDATSASSAESLKVEIPGGVIKIRDMSDNFEFTKVKGKKGRAVVSGLHLSREDNSPAVTANTEQTKNGKPVLETEV